MIFTVGVLYSAKSFLEFVRRETVSEQEFLSQFDRFEVSTSDHILEASKIGRWVRPTREGTLSITERGEEVLRANSPETALRIQLKQLIASARPPWASLIAKGRTDSRLLFPPAVLQCFEEAGLFGPPSDDLAKWWEILANVARGRAEDARAETGRIGERLSMKYERERTGRSPFWQSMEVSDAGYDLLSRVSKSDSHPLLIEVKTSTHDLDAAGFFLSRNEWNVAAASINYVVHFWILRPKPQLVLIPVQTVSKHVPRDRGAGYWKTVRIAGQSFLPQTRARAVGR